jgi:hypothetical protein
VSDPTSCPACDAPAPARARICANCGYRFVEAEAGSRPRVPAGVVLGGVAAACLVAAATLALASALGSGDDTPPDEPAPVAMREPSEVVSAHPLSTAAAERVLEALYVSESDDDTASVSCSAREARPAHSVRRCMVRYPNGSLRLVVLLTNARGAELLREFP